MKFECHLCDVRCRLECDLELMPEKCIRGFYRAEWIKCKITEPAALPKLTAAELERRGIQWPEWARLVAVDGNGFAYFFGHYCIYPRSKVWECDSKKELIPGKWDATDWRNSKIMRPAKVKEPDENRFTLDGVEYEAVAVESGHCSCCDLASVCPNVNHPPCANGRRDKRTVYFRKVKQLPDWLKLGVWAAVGKFVGKIDWINRDASECRITCGESRFAKTSEVKPVTFRAWTFEEAELQVGKAFRFKKTGYIGLMLGFHKEYGVAFPASGEHRNVYFSSLDELFEQGEQLSGLPCGVQQVDGADLEGMPCD